jgi:hypothetical protein
VRGLGDVVTWPQHFLIVDPRGQLGYVDNGVSFLAEAIYDGTIHALISQEVHACCWTSG